MSELTQTGFDYAALPVDAALNARAAAERIKLRLKRTVEDIIEIGRELTAVKAELPHGEFLPWIAAEFEMSQQTANNFTSVYERFGNGKLPNFGNFKPSILYALSAPSTPEAVIEKAVAKAESGEKVTVADVKDWKADSEALRQRLLEVEQDKAIEQQRNAEWAAQNKANHEKIQSLELDLLNVKPVEIEKPVVPDDYEDAKTKAAQLATVKTELEKLKKEQAKIVDQQVKAKLKGYQSEVDKLEAQKKTIEEIVDRKKAYLDSLDSEVKRIEVHQTTINGVRLELIGLAGFLNDLDPIEDKATIKKWLALAGMLDDASNGIRSVFAPHDNSVNRTLQVV